MVDSIPGCITYYPAFIAPNGPCDECECLELCKEKPMWVYIADDWIDGWVRVK